jgi:hypothetical protein
MRLLNTKGLVNHTSLSQGPTMTPDFIKKFQTELLCTLFDYNNVEEVVTKDMRMLFS